MDELKKSELIKACFDRDDWEIVPWGFMDNLDSRYVCVRTRDGKFNLSSVPIGYLGKEELLEMIETLQDKIEDMEITERMRE